MLYKGKIICWICRKLLETRPEVFLHQVLHLTDLLVRTTLKFILQCQVQDHSHLYTSWYACIHTHTQLKQRVTSFKPVMVKVILNKSYLTNIDDILLAWYLFLQIVPYHHTQLLLRNTPALTKVISCEVLEREMLWDIFMREAFVWDCVYQPQCLADQLQQPHLHRSHLRQPHLTLWTSSQT